MKSHSLFLILFFATSASSTLAQQTQQSHMRRATEQNGGFMQGGMHHTVMPGVVLDQKQDATTHTITLRIGPMNLPADTSHMKMPQPADLVDEVWLYSSKKVIGPNGVPALNGIPLSGLTQSPRFRERASEDVGEDHLAIYERA